jgi:diguanylate cyclase (GGDEF)-like protein
MEVRDRNTNIFVIAITPLAFAAVGWAITSVRPGEIDWGVIALATMTLFCSIYLRIKLPRLNAYLTISDGLIMLSMLLYGGHIALLLATIEAAVISLNFIRTRVAILKKTIAVNIMVNALAVFAAAMAVQFIFGPTEIILNRGNTASFIWMLLVMAGTLFLTNSTLVALYTAIKKGAPIWRVWSDNLVGAAVMYGTGAIVAGIMHEALRSVDVSLLAGVIGFFFLIYLTFRRFSDDVRSTADRAKEAEQQRAAQAEQHINELKHYVAELERSSEALQASHENFRHAAYHDALTGLPNRNYFIDTLKELLAESNDEELNFAVLLLDLKNFKTINDSLGHSMGDKLIKHVGKRLTGMARGTDMVARFSGDKFGIILRDLLNRDEATAFADRLAKRVAEPYSLEGRQVFTSVKVGIAYGHSKYEEAEDILRDADIAMYYSKDNSENYVIYDPKMHVRAVTRLQLETDLRFAIERNEFELYYQPIIGLAEASLVGFEALVRWNHPQRGVVPPNEFIPIAESTGLIVPMTLQILLSACGQTVEWQERTGEPLSIAVNLSGKHFAHPELVGQIENVIKTTHIPANSLKLEITESAVMENAESAIQMLQQIKETGVQVSIDDFGTGYSSLSYLHRFPIDLLKVDRSFVSAMEDNSENGEIVRTVIALAKALNLRVVAEGIESIHQYHQLTVLGCEYGQGYLFSKPLRVADIDRLLQDPDRWRSIVPTSGRTLPHNPNISHLRLAQ